MRKVKISFIIIFIALLIFYSRYYTGVYFDLNPKSPIDIQTKTEGKSIYVYNNDEKKHEKFEIRGVEVKSTIPGSRAMNYDIEKKDWLKWFDQIHKMGANTIKISNIFDDKFYNAFYEFNSANDEKIYLIQGISVSDYANNSSGDAYSKGFFDELQKDSIRAVDVIHGKRNMNYSERNGSGWYRKDVSPWVLGYIIGNEWNSGTMAYTNNNKKHSKEYEGKYFVTDKDSTVFEAMLANIMDEMVAHESKRYKTQRLMSFINSQQDDPFVYEKHYGKQLNKYNFLDAEKIKATEEFKGGYIATYSVSDFVDDFSRYLSQAQKVKLSKELGTLNKELVYEGYTQLLNMYHSMPVIILADGFSTARGTDEISGPITEIEQGQKLVSMYRDIVSSGCSGSIITSWQDPWEGSHWNTSYAVDFEEKFLWRDVQTKKQGYGLVSFDSGEYESIAYIDGDSSEWKDKDKILENEDSILSLKYDEAFVYLLLEKDKLSKEDNLYIGIDTTPKSGSKVSQDPRLEFDREVDFIVQISGRNNSRILVQERYESLRENYLMDINGDDPFTSFPEKDSSKFVPIHMVCKFNKMIPDGLEPHVIKEMKRLDTFETGKLIYGNSNPSSMVYNSLGDYYFGDDLVEIRIPWQMLNFSNPSEMRIHDDYYENYGVEEISISNLYIGIAELNGKTPTEMLPVKLNGWGNKVTYHERLKKSYYMLKEEWGK